MRSLAALALAAFGVVLAACDTSDADAEQAAARLTGAPASVSARWEVVTIGGEAQPETRHGIYAVTFAGARTLSGHAACSVFGGAYTASGGGASGRLRVEIQRTEALPTFVACTPAEEAYAGRLLDALGAVRSFDAEGGDLVLRGDGPEVRLTSQR